MTKKTLFRYSRRCEDNARISDDVFFGACDAQPHVVVLELVVQAGSHPGLDLGHP